MSTMSDRTAQTDNSPHCNANKYDPNNNQEFGKIKTLRTQNGEKLPRIFSDEEYERRLAKLRKHMVQEVI